jgi:P27 family predicted phage terminase small subunit
MGSRGPAPRTANQLQLRGSRRAKSRGPNLDVKPANDLPKPPAEMPEMAVDEWARIVPILHDRGVLGDVDRGVLISYCLAWAEYHTLDMILAVATKDTKVIKRMRIRRDNRFRQYVVLLQKLGLSPADRGRVTAAEKTVTKDPKDRFFEPRLAHG